MKQKILSVVVPTYNMEKYLARCLGSLVVENGTMDMLEVLVINDGSTDGSSEIAHSYEKEYPEVFRTIDKENGNYGSCVNRGLAEAKGRYIKILDADDYFAGLERFMPFLLDSNSDVIVSNVKTITSTGESTTHYPLPRDVAFSLSEISKNVVESIFMHAITYRTAVLREMHYEQTEGISYTDLEWSFYPMANVCSASFYDGVVYNYDMSREGQTVNPLNHCKNMWMEKMVLEKMLSSLDGIRPLLESDNRPYLEARLYGYVKKLYEYYLVSFSNVLDDSDLKSFDDVVSSGCPSIYYSLENEVLRRRFLPAFNYIAIWRKTYKRKDIRFKIYDYYQALVNRLLSF